MYIKIYDTPEQLLIRLVTGSTRLAFRRTVRRMMFLDLSCSTDRRRLFCFQFFFSVQTARSRPGVIARWRAPRERLSFSGLHEACDALRVGSRFFIGPGAAGGAGAAGERERGKESITPGAFSLCGATL